MANAKPEWGKSFTEEECQELGDLLGLEDDDCLKVMAEFYARHYGVVAHKAHPTEQ